MKLYYKLLTSFLCFCFSAKGQNETLIAVQQRPDSVVIFSLKNQIRIAQLPTGLMPHELCYDSISKRCFITNFGVEDYDTRIGKPGNSITVINPFSKNIVKTILTRPDSVANCPHGIKVRPGQGRELFVNIEIGDSMLVYDLNKLTIKRKFPVPKGTHNFIFSPSGDSLWIFTGVDGVYQLNPKDGNILQHKLFTSPIRGLALIKENLLASGKNELFIISRKDLSTIKHIENIQAGQILYSAVSNDKKYIISPAAFDNMVLIIDAETGDVLHRLQTGKAPINVQVTNDFAFVSQALDDHITKIDLKTFTVNYGMKVNGTNGIIIIK